MATTGEMHDDDTWAWPCPYCRASNPLDAPTCDSCGAQLRDPDEDDLFTTVATDNAQVIDPGAPRIKESLWSTDAPDPDVVDAEPVEPSPRAEAPVPPPPQSPVAPGAGSGPFSASRPAPQPQPADPRGDVFGAGAPRPVADGHTVFGRNPFGAPAPEFAPQPPPTAAAPVAAPAPAFAAEAPPTPTTYAPAPADPPGAVPRPGPPPRVVRATPDLHGLSVAVDSLEPAVQEECAVPIAVCGALLADQEVVLGILAGHLLGHAAVVVLTNARVMVANARRWKPLVDVFHPGPDLVVHTRHDRDVASLTFVQGDRLTGVDDISNVASALEMAERIRALTPFG